MPDPAARSPAVAGVLDLAFREQVAFFRGKLGNLVPTKAWDDLKKNEHDTAFMVAGAAKADLLADLAGAVDQAITDGHGAEWFRENFEAIVAKHGWTGWTGEGSDAGRAWRARVIHETNLATSYAAGRLAQLRAGGFKYWMYKHSDSVMHPRPLHLAWNGMVLPADAPFWREHYPPNGWGCRCRIIGVANPEDARALGGDPDKQIDPDWSRISTKTGEAVGIDKGWGYMPGANAVDRLGEFIKQKAAALPGPLGEALRDDNAKLNKDAFAALPDCSWGGGGSVDMAAPPGLRNCLGIAAGQQTYKDFGRPDLRDVPAVLRLPSPGLIERAATRELAVEVLSAELGLTAEAATRVIVTPVEALTIAREWLPHMVEKELDARERYARFILPTLIDPFEVYLTEYDDGRLRPRYIGLFQGERDLMCIVRRNQDGSVLWNVMQAKASRMNGHRVGELIYGK